MAPLGHVDLTKMQKLLKSKNKNQNENEKQNENKNENSFSFSFSFLFHFIFHFHFCFHFRFHFRFCFLFSFSFLCLLYFLVSIFKFYCGTSRPPQITVPKMFWAKIWELLPNNIKYSNSLSKFKKLMKSWKPDACPCRLCKTYIAQVGFIYLIIYKYFTSHV